MDAGSAGEPGLVEEPAEAGVPSSGRLKPAYPGAAG